ncbi:hypothetical protein HYT56_03720 [Candidatus Woesearchaeota archaeon]|nr:hypothetical protein [Candidatus Woesearchaeota archaeon]
MVTHYSLSEAVRNDPSLTGILNDIIAVAKIAYPEDPPYHSESYVMGFIIAHEVWQQESPLFRNQYPNVKLNSLDYLRLFKERLENWAYHSHTGSQEGDWYQALNGCAMLVRMGRPHKPELD